MTLFLLALAAAAPAGPADPAADQFRACTALVRESPERAAATADAWRLKGGGREARQCLGLAYSAAGRWAPAATAFEQAARDAELTRDASSADFWAQSGNAWLAGGEAANAIKAFDAALATSSLQAELRGEVHLDRARAGVALGDLAGARADLNKGLALVPADPLGWYLSAALARRQSDLPRARADIAKAVELAPREARILLEAGNIAGVSGDLPAARAFYARAAHSDPQGEPGRAAAAALAANAAGDEPPAPPAAAAPQSR
ncbi:MAG TPA: tetratricopeptide repeat protein [Geminicoccaceae bacterium]